MFSAAYRSAARMALDYLRRGQIDNAVRCARAALLYRSAIQSTPRPLTRAMALLCGPCLCASCNGPATHHIYLDGTPRGDGFDYCAACLEGGAA